MALGTHEAGFRHLALLELNKNAVETLRLNANNGVGVTPDMPLEVTNVRDISFENFPRNVDLLAGGAPCQPFSLGGVHKGAADDRNLFPEVFRAQGTLEPKAVLLENVKGLARPSFRPYLEYILLQVALPGHPVADEEDWRSHKARLRAALEAADVGDAPAYDVWIAGIEAANLAVPQRRGRVFIVAFRSDLRVDWTWPEATHSKDALHHAKYVSSEYWKDHDIEPQPDSNGGPVQLPASVNGHERWRTVRDALADLPEPVDGRPHDVHPNHVGVPGARSYPGHTGSPWDEPAKTLKAGVHGVPGGENMLRREDGSVRYFTVHESALLQTFPEEYVFAGSRTEAMRQIGNAAPVKVVKLLAERIAHHLHSGAPHVPANGKGLHVDLVDEAPLTSI